MLIIKTTPIVESGGKNNGKELPNWGKNQR